MRVGSVCSGVGGMDMGLEAAGLSVAWQCEYNAQCRQVLAHRFPGVPCFDNLIGLADRDDLEPVQLLAGGTPCQDLSVAGRRAGLDGERSGLFFEFIRLADRLAPDWLLWENVPGALSSQHGEDFAVCLEGFTGFRPAVPAEGWKSSGWCVGPLRWCVWRVLDAQYFGVAQRRARVFVVAGTGAQPRPEVLLEPDCVSGDSAPRRATGEGAAPILEIGARTKGGGDGRNGCGIGEPGDPMFSLQAGHQHGVAAPLAGHHHRADLDNETYVPMDGREWPADLAPTLNAHYGTKMGLEDQHALGGAGAFVAHTLRGEGADASEDGTGRGTPIVAFGWNKSPSQTMRTDALQADALQADALQASPTSNPAVLAPTLRCGGREQGAGSSYDNTPVVAIRTANTGANGHGIADDVAHTLDGANGQGVAGAVIPRRLTPTECLRLMGWPDWWLDITPPLADSPKYRMIGNGVVAPVAQWIGERIKAAA